MKIRTKGNEVQFSEIAHGDVFRDNITSHVCMRMYEVESDCNNVYNAVDLHDGDITYFDSTDMVEPIPGAELVI